MTRRKLVVGNWKMHGTLAESTLLTRSLQSRCVDISNANPESTVEVVIAPPFTALAVVAAELGLIELGDLSDASATPVVRSHDAFDGRLRVGLAAQSMDSHESGAFTGEISPAMLTELGVGWVILGHSERRAFCGETDAGVSYKTQAALKAGLTPIVAVGETAAQHQAGLAHQTIVSQIRAAFAALSPVDVARCVVAYEPIWAIGTGMNDQPSHANQIMQIIRSAVPGLEHARLLYGGSVRPENAADYFAEADIDGALVGGASLTAESFSDIIAAADTAGKVQQHT